MRHADEVLPIPKLALLTVTQLVSIMMGIYGA
jgi:hypothetical protein